MIGATSNPEVIVTNFTQISETRIQRDGPRYLFGGGVARDLGNPVDVQRFLRHSENPVPDFTAMIEPQYVR